MKSLNILVKINMRELDELRKLKVQREEEKQQLINYQNKMIDELAREHELAAKDPYMGAMFVNYKKTILERQKNITKSLQDIEGHLEYLQDEIQVKFSEVKKYEILVASQIAAEKKAEDALQTKQLDEISVQNYTN